VKLTEDTTTCGISNTNWFFIALGIILILGGATVIAAPICVPCGLAATALMFSAGGTTSALGLGLAYRTLYYASELKKELQRSIDACNYLRDVLAELENLVDDHHRAVEVLQKLNQNGEFPLADAEKMCETFESLRRAFRTAIARKTSIPSADTVAIMCTAVVAGVGVSAVANAAVSVARANSGE
jgi:hypothetical protein